LLKVDILAAPQTAGSILYGLYDILMIPEVWPQVILGEPPASLVRVRIVSVSTESFECRGGVPVTPHVALRDANDADIVCVPNMTIPLDQSPHGRFAPEVAWLQECHASGKTIASVCSGALLLAETGLLDGQTATAHWLYENMFRQFYPRIDFRPERVLTFAGDEDRLVLAGGMSSWQDLALYLIARFLGPEYAVHASKIYVVADHTDGQLPYAAFARRIQNDDPAIKICQLWLSDNYEKADAVAQMHALSGLARRTFSRRFKATTGYKPLEYVQALRIEEAKQLLESTPGAIDEVAASVGYQDGSAFRRLFQKRTGLTPSAYRKKFHHSRFDIAH